MIVNLFLFFLCYKEELELSRYRGSSFLKFFYKLKEIKLSRREKRRVEYF